MATKTDEIPINFNAEMVKAILEGRKTQTRRCLKDGLNIYNAPISGVAGGPIAYVERSNGDMVEAKCPYGQKDTVLWIRDAAIKLLVKDVRIERLQDITPDDAVAEGLDRLRTKEGPYHCWKDYSKKGGFIDARISFRTLWDSIYGKKQGCDWASNCWVWVVEFERLTHVDQ